MGLCCSNSRHHNEDDSIEDVAYFLTKQESNFESITNFSTEASKDSTYLKQVYSNASKAQSIKTFLQYLKMDMRIEIDSNITLGWISCPKTLSDLAAYQIMYLVSQKKKTLLMHQSNSNAYESLLDNFKLMIETRNDDKSDLIMLIKKHLTSCMQSNYDSDLNCKADCFMLLLANISEIREVCDTYLVNKEIMDFLITYCLHISEYKPISNSKQHIIICLQVLRKIYSTDLSMRMHFIVNQGSDMLNSIIEYPQCEQIYEVFYNIQDLVYVSPFLYNIIQKDDQEIERMSNNHCFELKDLVVTELTDLLATYHFKNLIVKMQRVRTIQLINLRLLSQTQANIERSKKNSIILLSFSARCDNKNI